MSNRFWFAGIMLLVLGFLGNGSHSPAAAATAEPTVSPLVGWNLIDPQDPSQPTLIMPATNGYRLTPGWTVARIEYRYDIINEVGSPSDYQVIDHVKGQYIKDKRAISAVQVSQLVQAIQYLQPTQLEAVSNLNSDDYPLWRVDITGDDGQHIYIETQSTTDNSWLAPWNVYYNGRLYAQFDGSIGKAIFKLFQMKDRSLNGAVIPAVPDAIMPYYAYSRPGFIASGFDGLLLLADSFQYSIDYQKSEITGSILGGQSSEWHDDNTIPLTELLTLNMLTGGKVNRLAAVELTLPDGKKLACTVPNMLWQFTCNVPGLTAKPYLHYPIRLTLSSDKGKQITVVGTLRGGWGPDARLRMPLSAELQPSFGESALIADLSTDHFIQSSYEAIRSLKSGKVTAIDGEATLYGAFKTNGATVPYIVSTHYIIHNDKLEQWGLTRDELQKTLDDIAASSIFKHALQVVPRLQLYITYDRIAKYLPDTVTSYNLDLTMEVPGCGTRPAVTLPSADEALRKFSFSTESNKDTDSTLYFVLIHDEPYVYKMDDTADGQFALISTLLSKDLQSRKLAPFAEISISPNSADTKPSVQFVLPKGIDAVTTKAYEQIISGLPGTAEKTADGTWTVHNVAVMVTNEGSLNIQSCGGN